MTSTPQQSNAMNPRDLNPELKYLFTATFADGEVIQQTKEDTSKLDKEGKRSQYFDVLETEKKKELVEFILKGDGREFGVGLRDGTFILNGERFKMIEGVLPFYRLIFFRGHTWSFNQKVATGETVATSHEIVYRVGWQCTDDGKNYQRVMQME